MIGRYPLDINSIEYSELFSSRPSGICYDSVNDRIVITLVDEGKVKILNSTDLSEITSISGFNTPVLVAYDSLNNRYLVAEDPLGFTDEVDSIDSDTFSVTTNIFPSISMDTIRGIQFDYIGDRMFISSYFNDSVFVIKISDLSLITSFTVINPIGIYLDVANNKLYIARGTNKIISIYNATTYAFISDIDLSNEMEECYDLKIDPNDSNKLLITDRVEKRIAVMNKTTEEIIGYYGCGRLVDFIDMKSDKIYGCLSDLDRLGIIEKFYN